jgi:hypothetical protein
VALVGRLDGREWDETGDGEAMRRLSVCVASGALLITPAGAGAEIVLQHGIAGVQLHMTKRQVRALLGTPRQIRSGRNFGGPFTQFVYPRVTVEFQRVQTVTALRTSSPLEQTTAGVGVGSTERQVKAGVPHVGCDNWSGHRQCVLGQVLPGRVVTVFAIKKGRVSNVIVGVVQHS